MNTSMEQDREPRNRPTKYSQLIFYKGAKTNHGGRIVFSTKGARITGHPHAK